MPINKEIKKVLVIGSGPIVIGQAAEFDYAGTQSCLALKEDGIEVVLVNSNPATIMTDEEIADRIYFEPLTVESIEAILKIEQPDGIIGTLGGQTGLNLTVQLYEFGLLEKYNVQLLGTSVDSIQKGEDREKFRQLMIDIHEPIPQSKIIESVEEGFKFAHEIGYPVIIRPAYTLGGSGGGFAANDDELKKVLKKGLELSPIHQVLLEKSIKGWKEVEYEVVRDENDTCIIVCNMENIDPVGVHTGDSIVVAPSQTLSDVQYQMLRNASLKVIRSLGVIGGCNIQFALDPYSDQYYIIEVNPRVSRSSALASKATGYPIARIATKCAIGYHLDEIINPVTGHTFASFEPALDYVVVKFPRFPFDKFSEADRTLGTQMKATGETMAIDRTFEGALNKGIRSLEMGLSSLFHPFFKEMDIQALIPYLVEASDLRIFAIAESMIKGLSIEEIHQYTEIDRWFLEKIKKIIDIEKQLNEYSIETVPTEILAKAKKVNISDERLSDLLNCSEDKVRTKRKELGLKPVYKLVDTCAAEFEAVTPYYYSTWGGTDEVEVSDRKKVLIIGSGPIRIGQGIEFDYCSVHAVMALRKLGFETIVVNNNPETVSTDFSIADKLYFEPLRPEDLLHIIEKENVAGVFTQFGGQTAINVAGALEKAGVPLFGTSVEAMDRLEDRDLFYSLLNDLNIPHIKGKVAHDVEMLKNAAKTLEFPVLVRPSYVIGGQSMFIFYHEHELDAYIQTLHYTEEKNWPLMIDQYVPGLECELDCISDGKNVWIPGIFEHIERAGVHSGDSIAVFPPQHLTDKQKQMLVDYAEKICMKGEIVGVANIQFVIHDDVVYVLEVNPRASRTVPILSKVTGIPIIDYGILAQTGQPLKQSGLAMEPNLVAVKAPIFSYTKLKNVDPVLGPEMKSTGEVLGIDENVEKALQKALISTQYPAFEQMSEAKPYIFCSVTDRYKADSLPMMKSLYDNGFQFVATEKTAAYLRQHGIAAEMLTTENVPSFFSENDVKAAVIIPTKGRDKSTVGNALREQAMRFSIPLVTSIDTFQSIVSVMKQPSVIQAKALNDFQRFVVEV
ncbi:carbamoyl-phosphate synthase (glutamine-hydrolyzing) large subunit [Heyndrickxia ginsengihumi]|uniref:Carbamoyl phosphate synthase large chain n=1 Tax=Heyndrickxia ginsengihumi TaxID=363870 RepID=A0A6M0P8F6_9BACI|nr:carbamoyl-phosphate synthase (glutamine-hydrolyzing) large subunit [Heyndrickxia ginsengihumi]MBE6183105.1 carbamoyl-phosphate synthase (glutamine-hydrolyzing) large subunit [Bacillus sp. (in: firmicutes)]NEY20565.1 carbamoyl-phosphate synthase (glutamine-hydrolyzing) large subunit [Heyndrickxia ginsengihumi]